MLLSSLLQSFNLSLAKDASFGCCMHPYSSKQHTKCTFQCQYSGNKIMRTDYAHTRSLGQISVWRFSVLCVCVFVCTCCVWGIYICPTKGVSVAVLHKWSYHCMNKPDCCSHRASLSCTPVLEMVYLSVNILNSFVNFDAHQKPHIVPGYLWVLHMMQGGGGGGGSGSLRDRKFDFTVDIKTHR